MQRILLLFLLSLIADHNVDDLFIGFSHAVSGKLGYVFDGLLDSRGHNAVSPIKFTAELIHFHSQSTGLHCRGDLCRTACFGSVADNSGINGQSIYNSMSDFLKSASIEISNPRSGSAACTDSAAVSGQRTDAGF